jgi:hypothetical protein
METRMRIGDIMGGIIWKKEWEITSVSWGWSYLKVILEMTPWKYGISWLYPDSITWGQGKGSVWVNRDNEYRRELLVQGQWKC